MKGDFVVGLDQPVHWVILLILAGLLFGGYKKLPEMARSAGRSMRVFKTELKGLEDDDQARAEASGQPTAYPQPVVPVPAPAPAPPAAPVAAIAPTGATAAPAAAPVQPAVLPVTDPSASPRA